MLRYCAAAAFLTTLSLASASARQDVISPANYLSHIRYLASDSLGGRGNGTEGLQRAGDYIASLLDGGGLKPAGDNGTFFQSFDGEMTVEPPPAATLVIRAGAQAETFTVGDQYYPLSIINHTPVAKQHRRRWHPGGVRRLRHLGAGPGLRRFRRPRRARHAAVWCSRTSRRKATSRARFDGLNLTPGAAISAKAREARERGARLLLVVGRIRRTSRTMRAGQLVDRSAERGDGDARGPRRAREAGTRAAVIRPDAHRCA